MSFSRGTARNRLGRFNPIYAAPAIAITALDITQAASQTQTTPFAPLDVGPPKDVALGPAESREGSIDAVNGGPLVAIGIKISNVLAVNGWMTVSGKDGIAPEAVFVTVADANGRKSYIRAVGDLRPDVKAHFHQPGMGEPGFRAGADLGGYSGDLTLGLARIRDGELHDCDNFAVALLRGPRADEARPAPTNAVATVAAMPETNIDACEANIDLLNGSPPSAGVTGVSDTLSIVGWMTTSGKDGETPEAVLVTLVGSDGKKILVKAPSASRPDIREHFGRKDMPDAGFDAAIPTVGMKGDYMLGLSRLNKGRLETCRQFKLPVSINATPK